MTPFFATFFAEKTPAPTPRSGCVSVARVYSLGMRLVTSVSAALILGVAQAGAVSPGDSADSVREELGRPDGQIEIGPNRVLFYERGEVVLSNDRVVKHNVMTEMEFAEESRRDAERKAFLVQLARERRLQREAEGLALKQSMLDDANFPSRSAAERVTYWRTFQKRYPMVPIDLELSSALAEYESARLIASNRALALKVNQLEAQLYEAQLSAYRSRSYSGSWFMGIGYGRGRYGGGYHPKPPHHPTHPDKGKGDKNYNSQKGSIMATMDRARGSYDRSYNASRSAIYRSVTP